MRIGTLPDGSRGFDVDRRVSFAAAQAMRAAGYLFAVRYVRRATPHLYDLKPIEVSDLLRAGLGLMLVQHVADPGWTATASLGLAYGRVAAEEAASLVPRGVTVWCDLEEVKETNNHEDLIRYLNNWYRAVHAAGFVPGLYVGDGALLSAHDLYYRLLFQDYWSAFNLDLDQYPAVRGVQMYQHQQTTLPGVEFPFDTDVIHADAKHGTPFLLLPS